MLFRTRRFYSIFYSWNVVQSGATSCVRRAGPRSYLARHASSRSASSKTAQESRATEKFRYTGRSPRKLICRQLDLECEGAATAESESSPWQPSQAVSSEQKPFDTLKPWEEVVRYNSFAGIILQLAVPDGTVRLLRARHGSLDEITQKFGANIEEGQMSTYTNADGERTELRAALISGMPDKVDGLRSALLSFGGPASSSSSRNPSQATTPQSSRHNQRSTAKQLSTDRKSAPYNFDPSRPPVSLSERPCEDLRPGECILRDVSGRGELGEVTVELALSMKTFNALKHQGPLGRMQSTRRRFDVQIYEMHDIGQASVMLTGCLNDVLTSLRNIYNFPVSPQAPQPTSKPPHHELAFDPEGHITPLDQLDPVRSPKWRCILADRRDDATLDVLVILPEPWKKIFGSNSATPMMPLNCSQIFFPAAQPNDPLLLQFTGTDTEIRTGLGQLERYDKAILEGTAPSVDMRRKRTFPRDGVWAEYVTEPSHQLPRGIAVVRDRALSGDVTLEFVMAWDRWTDASKTRFQIEREAGKTGANVRISHLKEHGLVSIIISCKDDLMYRMVQAVQDTVRPAVPRDDSMQQAADAESAQQSIFATTSKGEVSGDNTATPSLVEQMKQCLRPLTHPVAVITTTRPFEYARNDNMDYLRQVFLASHGVTVSSLAAVSLDPDPIISFNLRTSSRTYDAIRAAENFSVYFLTATRAGAAIAHAFTLPFEHPSQPFLALKTMPGVSVRVSRPIAKTGWVKLGGEGVLAHMVVELLPEKCMVVGDHVVACGKVTQATYRDSSPQHYGDGLAYSSQSYRGPGRVIKPRNLQQLTQGDIELLLRDASLLEIEHGSAATPTEAAEPTSQVVSKAEVVGGSDVSKESPTEDGESASFSTDQSQPHSEFLAEAGVPGAGNANEEALSDEEQSEYAMEAYFERTSKYPDELKEADQSSTEARAEHESEPTANHVEEAQETVEDVGMSTVVEEAPLEPGRADTTSATESEKRRPSGAWGL